MTYRQVDGYKELITVITHCFDCNETQAKIMLNETLLQNQVAEHILKVIYLTYEKEVEQCNTINNS